MIKTIIRPSDALAIFFSELEHPLSKPQQQHVMRIVEGLIVGQGRKTLSQLYAHWVDAPDASAVVDSGKDWLFPAFGEKGSKCV